MKKIILIVFTVFLNVVAFSCSPQSLSSEDTIPQACCGEDDHIPPPPPDGNGG